MLNVAKHEVVSTIASAVPKPTMDTVSWNGKYLIVEDTANLANQVTIYSLTNPETPVALATLTAGVAPNTDQVAPNNQYTFEISSGNPKAHINGSVEVIQLSDHPSVIKTIALPGSGDTVGTFSPNGQYLYVNVPSINKVAVISVSSQKLVDMISVGQDPSGLFTSHYDWVTRPPATSS